MNSPDATIGSHTTIVAELGTAHHGDRERARRLIAASADSGVDAVKFQWVIASEILHPLCGSIQLPGGMIPLFDRFRHLERPPEFYHFLKEEVEAAGMEFLCTPFGEASLAGLRALGVERIKLASPELNHLPLLRATCGFREVILSTGVSRLGDIEEALSLLSCRGILLHCVTSYPAQESDYNLNVIPNMAAMFEVDAGVSDHTRDPILVPVASVALGAVMVEKHLTLSNDGGGLDDPVAITPPEMGALVRAVRQAEAEGREETLARLSHEAGRERVLAVLGSGCKGLAPSEVGIYATTNRSVVAVSDIAVGDTISRENTALLRSEGNLNPGLPPREWDRIMGTKTTRRIPSGEGVCWHHLLSRSSGLH